MVAVIHSSKSVRNILYYNEKKVAKQDAKFLLASGFTMDGEKLSIADKLNHFRKNAELNLRTKVNSVHISLNFHPDDHLSEDALKNISEKYLETVGFAHQPYLVYQHFDSSHPHLHIVTTNIKNDGKRISLHNLGRTKSEIARKQIEQAFNLVKAESQKVNLATSKERQRLKKLAYAESNPQGIKKAIEQILEAVVPSYKYKSLTQLNAILSQYNVVADRGNEGSRVYAHSGLIFRVIDSNGKPKGVPIPASSFHLNPTLKNLEEKFKRNRTQLDSQKLRLKNVLNGTFKTKPVENFDQLKKNLNKQNIELILHQNEKGIVYGVAYIDYSSKCIFNGSDLGKEFSANALKQRFGIKHQKNSVKENIQLISPTENASTLTKIPWSVKPTDFNQKTMLTSFLESMLKTEDSPGLNPEFSMEQGKKKRRKQNL